MEAYHTFNNLIESYEFVYFHLDKRFPAPFLLWASIQQITNS